MKKEFRKYSFLFQHAVIRFMVIGGLGFTIDALLLWLGQHWLPLSWARLCSFSVAVTVTWLCNRVFTFQSDNPAKAKEWLRYVLVNTVGAVCNYSIFLGLIQSSQWGPQHFLISLAIASVLTAMLNYGFSKKWVFVLVNA